MTDISTSCKKFNMWPGPRILNGQYEKTVILVAGSSCAGKSTLCEKLLNDNLCFVCTDSICIRGGHQIKKILDYLDEHKEDNPINIGLMGIAISKMEEYKPFVLKILQIRKHFHKSSNHDIFGLMNVFYVLAANT